MNILFVSSQDVSTMVTYSEDQYYAAISLFQKYDCNYVEREGLHESRDGKAVFHIYNMNYFLRHKLVAIQAQKDILN